MVLSEEAVVRMGDGLPDVLPTPVSASRSVDNLFSCERCGYETDKKQALRTHLERSKPCPTIYSSKDRRALIKPLLRNESGMKHVCIECGKKFPQAAGL